ncbi:HAMP domain-containing sensor histidine kinase [Cellulomonas marina]|uniref:histidine kinase n=1 Tax=Cellulomonas marina TaxID=988821 RepID=A0A1I1AUU2_9CELL|nr:HAMP domain-containing sensor histidine kinase [Cellulomonas marina]GIG30742.1 two-component sensor histidine kinase [Cellulomonas marina]SFB41849.1 Signal transduction histidine kinase [Cellulomonas marina]
MSTPETRPPAATSWALGARLLAALVIVLATAAITAWLVASAVGPGLFHDHMLRAGLEDHDAAVVHAEQAFEDASTVSLALALGAAALAAAAVSLVLTRRIGRSLAAVSAAAARVGAGAYESRVPDPGLGAEFGHLARSFNAMADRLHEADRLRARLLADVAHEVRTPVATITGYLEAVEDGVQPLDEATMAVLREQGARLTRLAQDLAAVTHAEAGDLTLDLRPVPPADLLQAAAAAAGERAAAAGVSLEVEVADGLPRVAADRTRIAQVLDNLVSNAVRHTPPGGSIVLLATQGQDGRVVLEVSDTGEGIAAEHLPHVFERFYRADTARDRARGGSGIGLAISKALTLAHGGTLTAASAGPGKGATFTITLPTV